MMVGAIGEAVNAFAAIAAARANVDAERAKLAALMRQKDDEAEERTRLREAEESDAARRLVDGPDSAPEKPRRKSRLRNLDDNAPALVAAITLQKGRIADAEAAIAPLQIPLVAASLQIVADVQGDGMTQIRESLAGVGDAAARLLAADQIMAATVGTNGFPVPRGAPLPINGSQLLSNFLKAIPETLRPATLNPEELGSAARAISHPIIAEVKGNQK